MEAERSPLHIPPETTLESLIQAYVIAVMDEQLITNPLFESVAFVPEKEMWLHLKFNVTHQWVTEPSSAALESLK